MFFVWRADDVHQLLPKSMKSSMVVGFLGRGCSCRTPKDSGREDWGTLGNIREDKGNHHSGTLKNPIIYMGEIHVFFRETAFERFNFVVFDRKPKAKSSRFECN